MTERPLRVAGIVVGLIVTSCGSPKQLPLGPGGGTPDPNATFTRVEAEILAPSCALTGCHAGAAPQAGMDLTASAAFGSIVRVPSVERGDLFRIDPGDPERSYLVKKVRGDADISGSAMPLGGTPLSTQRLTLLTDWVLRGAPRD